MSNRTYSANHHARLRPSPQHCSSPHEGQPLLCCRLQRGPCALPLPRGPSSGLGGPPVPGARPPRCCPATPQQQRQPAEPSPAAANRVPAASCSNPVCSVAPLGAGGSQKGQLQFGKPWAFAVTPDKEKVAAAAHACAAGCLTHTFRIRNVLPLNWGSGFQCCCCSAVAAESQTRSLLGGKPRPSSFARAAKTRPQSVLL